VEETHEEVFLKKSALGGWSSVPPHYTVSLWSISPHTLTVVYDHGAISGGHVVAG